MKLTNLRELHSFLATHFFDADPSKDEETIRALMAEGVSEPLERVLAQAKLLMTAPDFPVDELGSEANRWFLGEPEARAWLAAVIKALENAQSTASVTVKDANGIPLSENDSVQVIKDLKVKGGASDLKRGTLIKRIHLIDDPEAIECRVDGSTLVLKTCFLKKA